MVILIYRLCRTGTHARAGRRGIVLVRNDTDRRWSIPYIVCDVLGFDTGDYSFAYVALWSDGSADIVRHCGARAVSCASQILGGT